MVRPYHAPAKNRKIASKTYTNNLKPFIIIPLWAYDDFYDVVEFPLKPKDTLTSMDSPVLACVFVPKLVNPPLNFVLRYA